MSFYSHQLPPIHHACSDDDLRPIMQNVLIDNGVAVAANAHVLVLINLRHNSMLTNEQLELMNGNMIHRDAWALLYSADFINPTGDGVICHRDGAKMLIMYEQEPASSYPNYKKIIESYDSKPEAVDNIGVDPKWISLLKKVFGRAYMGYQFMFYGKEKGIIIRPITDTTKYALVMPMMMNGCDETPFKTNLQD